MAAAVKRNAAQTTTAFVKAISAKKRHAKNKFKNRLSCKALSKKSPKTGKKTKANVCGPSPHLTKMAKRLGSSVWLKVSSATSLNNKAITEGAMLYKSAVTKAPNLLLVI